MTMKSRRRNMERKGCACACSPRAVLHGTTLAGAGPLAGAGREEEGESLSSPRGAQASWASEVRRHRADGCQPVPLRWGGGAPSGELGLGTSESARGKFGRGTGWLVGHPRRGAGAWVGDVHTHARLCCVYENGRVCCRVLSVLTARCGSCRSGQSPRNARSHCLCVQSTWDVARRGWGETGVTVGLRTGRD
jgi:hypothetical protein